MKKNKLLVLCVSVFVVLGCGYSEPVNDEVIKESYKNCDSHGGVDFIQVSNHDRYRYVVMCNDDIIIQGYVKIRGKE